MFTFKVGYIVMPLSKSIATFFSTSNNSNFVFVIVCANVFAYIFVLLYTIYKKCQ